MKSEYDIRTTWSKVRTREEWAAYLAGMAAAASLLGVLAVLIGFLIGVL